MAVIEKPVSLVCEEVERGADDLPDSQLPIPEPTKPVGGNKPRDPPQPKPKPPRAPKRGQVKCPGCVKLLMGDQFPIGSKYCFPCKRIKDSLYKATARTNEQAWLTKLLSTEQGTKKAFDQFRALEGVAMHRPRKH